MTNTGCTRTSYSLRPYSASSAWRFGAFGAHGLRSRLTPEMLAVFEIGVRYQMYHVFALLIIAAAIGTSARLRLLTIAGWSFIAGTLIFSGSLYALALTGTGDVRRDHANRRAGFPDRLGLPGVFCRVAVKFTSAITEGTE